MKSLLLVLAFSALLIVFSRVPDLHFSPSPSATNHEESAVSKTSAPEEAPVAAPAEKPAPVVSEPVTTEKPAMVEAQPTPKPAPKPAPEPETPSDFASDTTLIVHALTNEARAQNDLSSLAWDAELARIAKAHSADMLARGYFDHDNPEGCSSSCRATNAGYEWQRIGENIYMSKGYEVAAAEEADMAVDGWLDSPGHRANMLGAEYTHAGVGVAAQGEAVYITALYAKPR